MSRRWAVHMHYVVVGAVGVQSYGTKATNLYVTHRKLSYIERVYLDVKTSLTVNAPFSSLCSVY